MGCDIIDSWLPTQMARADGPSPQEVDLDQLDRAFAECEPASAVRWAADTFGDGLVLTTRGEPGGTLGALFPVFEAFDRNEVKAAEQLVAHLHPDQDRRDRLSAARSLETLAVPGILPSHLPYTRDQDADVAAAVSRAVTAIDRRMAEGRTMLPSLRPHRMLGSIAWTRGGPGELAR